MSTRMATWYFSVFAVNLAHCVGCWSQRVIVTLRPALLDSRNPQPTNDPTNQPAIHPSILPRSVSDRLHCRMGRVLPFRLPRLCVSIAGLHCTNHGTNERLTDHHPSQLRFIVPRSVWRGFSVLLLLLVVVCCVLDSYLILNWSNWTEWNGMSMLVEQCSWVMMMVGSVDKSATCTREVATLGIRWVFYKQTRKCWMPRCRW